MSSLLQGLLFSHHGVSLSHGALTSLLRQASMLAKEKAAAAAAGRREADMESHVRHSCSAFLYTMRTLNLSFSGQGRQTLP